MGLKLVCGKPLVGLVHRAEFITSQPPPLGGLGKLFHRVTMSLGREIRLNFQALYNGSIWT